MREAVYDGTFGTPKTEAGLPQIPPSELAMWFIGEWKERASRTEPDVLVVANRTAKVIQRKTSCVERSSRRVMRWNYHGQLAHVPAYLLVVDKGVPGKVVAQLMGHANVDTTLNVYTQVLDGALRNAVETIGGELFTIVHRPEGSAANALKCERNWRALQDSNLRPPGS